MASRIINQVVGCSRAPAIWTTCGEVLFFLLAFGFLAAFGLVVLGFAAFFVIAFLADTFFVFTTGVAASAILALARVG